MKKIILDCSATLSLLLPDEVSQKGGALLSDLMTQGASVPSIWALEVANGLLTAQRRKRIDRETRFLILNALKDFSIIVDTHTPDYAFNKISILAEEHGLTLYDAAYLELAIRLKGVLATFDEALIKTAKKMKVGLYFS